MNNEILERLKKLYCEYSCNSNAYSDSLMYEFWADPLIEILCGSYELDAVEREFGITFSSDDALEIYERTVKEAAEYIENMTVKQKGELSDYDNMIKALSPEEAKSIVLRIARKSSMGKNLIIDTLEEIQFEVKV